MIYFQVTDDNTTYKYSFKTKDYHEQTLQIKLDVKRAMSGKRYGYRKTDTKYRLTVPIVLTCEGDEMKFRRFIRRAAGKTFWYFEGTNKWKVCLVQSAGQMQSQSLGVHIVPVELEQL